MSKSDIHDRNATAREYSGQLDAEPLLGWLNRISSKTDEAACAALYRVTQIIETIVRIQDKAVTLKPSGKWERKPKEIRDEEAALNAALSVVRVRLRGGPPGGRS